MTSPTSFSDYPSSPSSSPLLRCSPYSGASVFHSRASDLSSSDLSCDQKDTETIKKLSSNYVLNSEPIIDLEEFEPEDIELPLERKSTRTPSYLLNGNHRHIQHYYHKSTQAHVSICFFSRMVRVKRFQGKFKTAMELLGYEVAKIYSKDNLKHPALAPFVAYLPEFLFESGRSRSSKRNAEIFSHEFKVFIKVSDDDSCSDVNSPASQCPLSSSPPPSSPEETSALPQEYPMKSEPVHLADPIFPPYLIRSPIFPSHEDMYFPDLFPEIGEAQF